MHREHFRALLPHRDTIMRRRMATVLAIVLVVGAVVLAYTYLLPTPTPDSPAAAQQPPAVKPFPVQTVLARRGTLTQSISATGDIVAEARVEVFPKIVGHLEELGVEEGDSVHAGQAIARIANAEFRARVARAAAEVEALQAEWAQMQSGALPEEIAQAVDAVGLSVPYCELSGGKSCYDFKRYPVVAARFCGRSSHASLLHGSRSWQETRIAADGLILGPAVPARCCKPRRRLYRM